MAGDGALRGCAKVREAPSGEGFDTSAATVAGLMRANLWTRDGEAAVGQKIRRPLRFVYSGKPKAAAASAPAAAPGS